MHPQPTARPHADVVPGVNLLGASPGNVRCMHLAAVAESEHVQHKILEVHMLQVLVVVQAEVPASA